MVHTGKNYLKLNFGKIYPISIKLNKIFFDKLRLSFYQHKKL